MNYENWVVSQFSTFLGSKSLLFVADLNKTITHKLHLFFALVAVDTTKTKAWKARMSPGYAKRKYEK